MSPHHEHTAKSVRRDAAVTSAAKPHGRRSLAMHRSHSPTPGPLHQHGPRAPAPHREFGFNNALAGLLTTGSFATHARHARFRADPRGSLERESGSAVRPRPGWRWVTSRWRFACATGSCSAAISHRFGTVCFVAARR